MNPHFASEWVFAMRQEDLPGEVEGREKQKYEEVLPNFLSNLVSSKLHDLRMMTKIIGFFYLTIKMSEI